MEGSRHIKIRKGENYGSTLSDGTEVTFQEQVGSANRPVHTHVWIKPPHPDLALYLVSFLMNEAVYHPYKTDTLALVQGWNLKEKDDMTAEVELVINRKLSESLFNFVVWYAQEVMVAVNGYAAMTSLFGDQLIDE